MNYVKILGSSGSKTKTSGTSSFQVSKNIIIDTGNVINTLGDECIDINHIFISHSHSDHITDLPFIIETFFEYRKETLKVYALNETIQHLQEHFFNNLIWPDFTKINFPNTNTKALEFIEISINKPSVFGEYEIKAIPANHIKGSCGFVITKNESAYILSGDTGTNFELIDEINQNEKIKSLLIECSYPNSMSELAHTTKHLNPILLQDMLKNIKRNDVSIFLYHQKYAYKEQIKKDVEELGIFKNGGKFLEDGDKIHILTNNLESKQQTHNQLHQVMDINLALSTEFNRTKLLEMIVSLTRELTNCDAGTLYIKSKDEQSLEFKIVQNDSLNIFLGGEKSNIDWNSIPLYHDNGEKNFKMVATTCALKDKIINIKNIYDDTKFNFEGTKKFDSSTGYKSTSMLVIPLTNHNQEVIGVLQLLNKQNFTKDVIEFDKEDEYLIKALASQAAMALTNTMLIDNLEEFLEAFILTIGKAIDAKSPYTTRHVSNVSKISNSIAQAIHNDETVYQNESFNDNDYKQIQLASWLHDIGKISIPEYIIDKSKKLETVFDRVELIKERFNSLKKDYYIEFLEGKISQEQYRKKIEELKINLEFIEQTNHGGEFLSNDKIDYLKNISKITYNSHENQLPLLNENELYNLCIQRGTLNKEEREIINKHAQLSYEMLSTLPFPKKYSKVLDIACNHHEKLDGTGHPRGLKEKDFTTEDKILIFSDVIEALTSNDRPYKKGKTLSETKKILSFMVKDGEIEEKMFNFIFNHPTLIKEYANNELEDFQKDLDFK